MYMPPKVSFGCNGFPWLYQPVCNASQPECGYSVYG